MMNLAYNLIRNSILSGDSLAEYSLNIRPLESNNTILSDQYKLFIKMIMVVYKSKVWELSSLNILQIILTTEITVR